MPGREPKSRHQLSSHCPPWLAALACALTLLVTACSRSSPIPSPSLDNPLSTSEREALVAFYDAAGGPNWRFNKGWLEGDPIGDEVKVTGGRGSLREPRGGLVWSPDRQPQAGVL